MQNDFRAKNTKLMDDKHCAGERKYIESLLPARIFVYRFSWVKFVIFVNIFDGIPLGFMDLCSPEDVLG